MNKGMRMLIASGLGFSALVWAGTDHHMPAHAYSKEFEQIKQLAGTWKGTSSKPSDEMGGVITTEYRVTAAGSAIEERLMGGTPHEMVDMYTDESGKLVMTHYCAMGNQPHMVLKKSDAKQIALETDAAPGLDIHKDAHMHALTIEFPDKDHMVQRWTSHQDGKPMDTAVFTFARVPNK